MSLSDHYQKQIAANREKVAAEKANITLYQGKIKEIETIYKKLKAKKKEVKTAKKEMNSFSKETYPRWKGNIFNEKFKNPIQNQLVGETYEAVIKDIDSNMDKLNDKKTEYQNKILTSQGMVGSLISSINSFINSIENLVN